MCDEEMPDTSAPDNGISDYSEVTPPADIGYENACFNDESGSGYDYTETND